jgi:hypothetical protein
MEVSWTLNCDIHRSGRRHGDRHGYGRTPSAMIRCGGTSDPRARLKAMNKNESGPPAPTDLLGSRRQGGSLENVARELRTHGLKVTEFRPGERLVFIAVFNPDDFNKGIVFIRDDGPFTWYGHRVPGGRDDTKRLIEVAGFLLLGN